MEYIDNPTDRPFLKSIMGTPLAEVYKIKDFAWEGSQPRTLIFKSITPKGSILQWGKLSYDRFINPDLYQEAIQSYFELSLTHEPRLHHESD
jgi:hypothetical protein